MLSTTRPVDILSTSIDSPQTPTTRVPDGFPSVLEGPLIWEGKDFASDPGQYIYELSQEEISELEKAIAYFKGTKLARGFLSPLSFPLPDLMVARLKRVNDIIYKGRGFVVLRGIDPRKYDEEEIVLLYAGICSHIANHRGNTLDHIVESSELRVSDHEMGLSGAEQDGPMMFHTDFDSGSLLSLFCHTASMTGGKQHLVSGWKIYNTMAELYPDDLETLTNKFEWALPNPCDDGKTDVHSYRPIIGHLNGQVQFNFGPEAVTVHVVITPEKKQALNTLHKLCRALSVELTQQEGDLLFVNNLAILHARDSYKDPPAGEGPKRRIMCLMLHDDATSWELNDRVMDYHVRDMFEYLPTEQLLFTVSEWAAAPRDFRYRISKYAMKHG